MALKRWPRKVSKEILVSRFLFITSWFWCGKLLYFACCCHLHVSELYQSAAVFNVLLAQLDLQGNWLKTKEFNQTRARVEGNISTLDVSGKETRLGVSGETNSAMLTTARQLYFRFGTNWHIFQIGNCERTPCTMGCIMQITDHRSILFWMSATSKTF